MSGQKADIDFYPLLTSKSERISEFKLRKSEYLYKSIRKAEWPNMESKGWIISKENKHSFRIKKRKYHAQRLEDRAWCLFYKMGYEVINGDRFTIKFKRENDTLGKKQIDVFCKDNETVIVGECKSRKVSGRRRLAKDIHETIHLQNNIRDSIFKQFSSRHKPKIAWLYITQNIIWSRQDIERAASGNIIILTENELQYFEAFIKNMGPAGRYQVLAEFFKGQKVEGLSKVTIPAIKGKIGGETFYSFVCTPRSLLKISFVNHQALNHPDGRPAYQRMVIANRIKEIGKFIKDGGFFPTNLLINFIEKPRFDLISSKENTDKNIKFGWLTLPQRYKSALIIDGQHRLFGYSYLEEKLLDQSLLVVAFDNVETTKEADLFITINHKQKSVPSAIIDSLKSDLKIDSDDPKEKIEALASSVVKFMNLQQGHPLYQRFKIEGVTTEIYQNLTISEAMKGLSRSGLLGKVIHNTLSVGPLSSLTDDKTKQRASDILGLYFDHIKNAHIDRWDAGNKAYIATNPAFRAHCLLISELFNYLEYKGSKEFCLLEPEEIDKYFEKYIKPICDYISTASDVDIEIKFSRMFGEGGVKTYYWRLCELINSQFSDFGSDEFKEYISSRDSERAKQMHLDIIDINSAIFDFTVKKLKEIHGEELLPSGERSYWAYGVENRKIKEEAHKSQQNAPVEDQLPIEAYLNVLDLIPIVKQRNNWKYFEPYFNIPLDGEKGKTYYLKWIEAFNGLRRTPSHKSSIRVYKKEDYKLVDILKNELLPKISKLEE